MTNSHHDSTLDTLQDMVIDQFGRIRQLMASVTDGLPDDIATWRPDADANSIAWLLWHLTRIQDDHIAGLAGSEQVWTAGGWYERFGLPFGPEVHGYGQSSDDVAQVQVSAALLDDYHAAVHEASLTYARSLTDENLRRIVDTNWNPPVTAAVRLVSVLGECFQHLGQAAYIRGMAGRARLG